MLASFLALSPIVRAFIVAVIISGIVLFVARRAVGKQGRKLSPRVLFGVPLAAVAIVLIMFSMITVQVGTVKVVTVFGRVQEEAYGPGLHFVFPAARAEPMVVRRQIFELSGGSLDDPDAVADGQRTLALSADRIPLAIDLNFPYQLNPDLAWKVFANIGPNYQVELLAPAARSSVREAAASFSWTDAVSGRREELEERIHTVFRQTVVSNLAGAGFTQEEAAEALTLMPPQIRRMSPPRRILAAVGEVLAADEELKRQQTLVQVAEKEAERRAKEGSGVRMLIEQLPAGYSPEQMTQFLHSLADKQRADAMMRAVERDQVKVMVMGGEGGGQAAVAVPAP